jgi:AcrR family transcriptional regulator
MAAPSRKKVAAQAPRPYHHGDLRAALLKAAVEELAESGIEGLTLRGCARRAGVSHAAPAHHFGDVTGLLTEVAIGAHDKLAASLRSEIATVERGSAEHLIAAGNGYVRFALDNPGEFNLMFRRERLDLANPRLMAAGQGGISQAADAVGAYLGVDNAMAEPETARRVVALWSLAHGFASLVLAGQLGPLNRAAAITTALLPDMIRELFGIAPRNRAQDLSLIAKTARGR